MRVMVTGSRTWGACPHGNPRHKLEGWPLWSACPDQMRAVASMEAVLAEHGLFDAADRKEFSELILGDATGADKMAALIWEDWGLGPITAFPYVKELGSYGGHARNDVLVAHMPDLVLAFHLNHSPGTADAIARARKAGLDVHVYPKGDL